GQPQNQHHGQIGNPRCSGTGPLRHPHRAVEDLENAKGRTGLLACPCLKASLYSRTGQEACPTRPKPLPTFPIALKAGTASPGTPNRLPAATALATSRTSE